MWVAEFFSQSLWAYLGFSLLVGLIIGSFLNVVAYRLPIMLERNWRQECRELSGAKATAEPSEPFDLSRPSSRCPHCGHAIRAWENIPVLSYIMLGGKCSSCGGAINARYPIVEAATGVLSVIVAWHFGVTWEALAGLLLTWSLIALSLIDFDTQLLPDVITLPVLWLGLLLSLAGLFTNPSDAVIGAAAGYLSLWLVFQLFKRITGKEGMGYGDFKLFALFGAWLGWSFLPQIILLSSLVGAVVGILLIVIRGRDRNIPIPFGPYLAAAGWISLLWGDAINQAYLQWAGLS